MGKFQFSEEDFNNVELVREVLLTRLRTDQTWHAMAFGSDYFEQYVEYAHERMRDRFAVLASEVMWSLIIQGVITPGFNSSNPNLPFFRITGYGQQVLEAGSFIPHDPTGYLIGIKTKATTTVSHVSVAYIEEALRCYNAGCNSAATLLLGIAAESILLNLLVECRAGLKNPDEQRTYDRLGDQIRTRHRWLVDKLKNVGSGIRRQLPESLDLTLGALYDLMRRQRNDLGHPQSDPPKITREEAFVYLKLFPTFIDAAETLGRYCRETGW